MDTTPYTFKKHHGFQAVGIKWEGTFAEAEAGGIRAVQEEVQRRLLEIKHVTDPHTLLGLSYHTDKDRFTHYAVVEVEQAEQVPESMTSVTVPEREYLTYSHPKGDSVQQSYGNLFAWMERNGYRHDQRDLTHFEKYPMSQDPYTTKPEFTILIPVTAESDAGNG
ncbi:GyrI-like domain-containing protein [Paenibacillus gansuensis]|uniref:GyrI-like domain-containing protein n=1 Tax=Paenibacillus gansuensis TaxID=306542 RepID=A0ABW5PLV8_9BACL